MKKRLILAKELLKDDGVIFVSIDDNEQAYLKVLMDEIFGENNFMANMPRITRKGGKADKNVISEFDYLLIYCQNSTTSFGEIEFEGRNYKEQDDYIDTRGLFQTKPLDVDSLGYVKTLDFEIKFQKKSFFPGSNLDNYNDRKKDIIVARSHRWRWSEKKVLFGIENDWFVIKNNRLHTKIYRNVQIDKINGVYSIVPKKKTKIVGALHFLNEECSNFKSKKELESILGKGKFDFPKPTSLIKESINLVSNKNAIVLDFFAGSGTAAQAVMELNKEDNGNRKFILVTNNEKNIAQNICRERIYRVINGKGSEAELIDWAYSKDIQSLTNNHVKYLKVKEIDKVDGDYEDINSMKDLYKNEFNKNISIKDFSE